MKFTLIRPCKDCPFRVDCLAGWLGSARATEIVKSITSQQLTFACHETTHFDDNEYQSHAKAQHCAGAMIFLERRKAPNQMMRIAERLGFYDHRRLDMSAPVFNSAAEFIEHHDQERANNESG